MACVDESGHQIVKLRIDLRMHKIKGEPLGSPSPSPKTLRRFDSQNHPARGESDDVAGAAVLNRITADMSEK